MNATVRRTAPTELTHRLTRRRRKTRRERVIEEARDRARAMKPDHGPSKKTIIATAAGIAAGAAAFMKRRRSRREPEPTYSPPAEPSMPGPRTPAGVGGGNGSSTS